MMRNNANKQHDGKSINDQVATIWAKVFVIPGNCDASSRPSPHHQYPDLVA